MADIETQRRHGILFQFLKLLVTEENLDYARLGYRLLHDLDFRLEHYIHIYDIAMDARNDIAEAGLLMEKIDRMVRDARVEDGDTGT
ncbi:hypothetical protein GCK72_004664 [Caenorhabditis remanei]|uniref:Uncharacterized protein n=1 Tax=Caenorhabditis remanei TaxID=31234 RepID=A0A6A5HCX9_CAERE|nr:hypothetical protein GCK72_004664 [Caenorhabditis remanei]KAF1764714.1 hypothetical protein GCK72_004664 [Caenorhabditis remanei]